MSLWTDARVKELIAEVALLQARVAALEQPSTDLRAMYEEKMGKPPHHRMSEATIRAALG